MTVLPAEQLETRPLSPTPPTVAAVVVSHGPSADLEACLAALAPQVDELVLIVNVPAPLPPLPEGTRVVRNARPLGFSANVNIGVEATTAPFVCSVNPDAIVHPGAVRTLVDFAERTPSCGIAGPKMLFPDGSFQSSRRHFPAVGSTLVRRTPLRTVLPDGAFQRDHLCVDDRPDFPVRTDWMLGGFLLLRRSMLEALGGFDEGYRLYVEDIDIAYRAHLSGWDRWYVPRAVVTHRLGAAIDAGFLSIHNWWHARGMARYVRKFPTMLLGRRPATPDDDAELAALR